MCQVVDLITVEYCIIWIEKTRDYVDMNMQDLLDIKEYQEPINKLNIIGVFVRLNLSNN